MSVLARCSLVLQAELFRDGRSSEYPISYQKLKSAGMNGMWLGSFPNPMPRLHIRKTAINKCVCVHGA